MLDVFAGHDLEVGEGGQDSSCIPTGKMGTPLGGVSVESQSQG